jgi:hypothetical protein
MATGRLLVAGCVCFKNRNIEGVAELVSDLEPKLEDYGEGRP